jgi:hypothetical protein
MPGSQEGPLKLAAKYSIGIAKRMRQHDMTSMDESPTFALYS